MPLPELQRYVLAAANEAGIDLADALSEKEERNRQRFGAD